MDKSKIGPFARAGLRSRIGAAVVAATCMALMFSSYPAGAVPNQSPPPPNTSGPQSEGTPQDAPDARADGLDLPPQVSFLNGGSGSVGPQCIYYDNDRAWLGRATANSECDSTLHHRFTTHFLGQTVGYRFEMTDSPGHCLGINPDGFPPVGSRSCDNNDSVWGGGRGADGQISLGNYAFPPDYWYLIAGIDALGISKGPAVDESTAWQFKWRIS